MQYVFSMTSRMVTIAAASALLLCVLLFLLGVEIGARMGHPAAVLAGPAPAIAASVPTDVLPPQDPSAASSASASSN
ncbi:hypothetical protein [Caballeronia sp. LZ035]|uniref:hypothetical protein n=1 Tax=Caballeronia sp. LZ035 TaxID=3038568 RepID=UPI002856B025|nr:hypothetical protein [Caballeronia sp. LZ035]MDR5758684.1 hypothetical protein [Caballeronia sp. LZ035]